MSASQLFDLSSLDTVAACSEGAEIQLLHPVSRVPLDIFIRVFGKDSLVFKAHLRQSVNARLRKTALDRKRGIPDVPTVEAGEEDTIAALVACTTAWRTGEEPVINFAGENLSCTPASAAFIYSQLPWVREQIDEAVADLENFLKP